MQEEELKEKLNILDSEIEKFKVAYKLEEKIANKNKLEQETFAPDFYNDTEKSSKILQELKYLEADIKKIEEIINLKDEARVYLDLFFEENDQESLKEAKILTEKCEVKKEKLETNLLLSGPYDKNNAIVSIHPGAGGTESQDWTEMLYRMYQKWASSSEDYEIELLDILDGEEAGLKSVTFLVKGQNAYGYLKSENGVHRLVRISPFDANSRRHTSFAAVEVMPELDNTINVEIRQEDIRVDTYRSSGAGGQHINKTDSAVRITHIPTGIVVSCQTQRSQVQNKEYAMNMLKSKLYEKEIKEQEKLALGIKGESLDIAWGSQIRSYVFCPYTLVKDHRTDYEVGNVQGVMDGKIDEFMYEYLKWLNS